MFNRFYITHILISVVTTLLCLATVLGIVWWQWGDQISLYRASLETESATSTPAGRTISNVADTVEEVLPAVVSVVITAEVPVIESYVDDWFNPFGGWFGIPRERQRQIGTKEQEVGGGTGFFVSHDGYIVTNKHVVSIENAEYAITTHDGERYDVEVVAKDPQYDIAILKVDDTEMKFPFLPLATSTEPRLGESVIAIGNALAEFPNSVSLGVVSGLARNVTATDGHGATEMLEGVIQTDAAINRGNSGGPLLSTDGEVVGVNVAASLQGENIGFALPVSIVDTVYQSVQEHGKIVRPYLGVRYVEITPGVQARNNLPMDTGVIITRGESRSDLAILPGSPAARAGLQEFDVIVAVNGQAINETNRLPSMLRQYDVGEEISVTIWRDGEEQELLVTLDAAPTSL